MTSRRPKETDHAVKSTSLVPLWTTERVLRLTRTELTEVFCGFGRDVCEEFYLHPPQRFPYR